MTLPFASSTNQIQQAILLDTGFGTVSAKNKLIGQNVPRYKERR